MHTVRQSDQWHSLPQSVRCGSVSHSRTTPGLLRSLCCGSYTVTACCGCALCTQTSQAPTHPPFLCKDADINQAMLHQSRPAVMPCR